MNKLQNILLYVTLSIVIISFILYWVFPFHKNDKFKVFMSLISAVSSFLLIITLIAGIYSARHSEQNNKIKTYDNYADFILKNASQIFLENEDMMYLYNCLLGKSELPDVSKRNIAKENSILIIIYVNVAKVCNYIYNTTDIEYGKVMKDWLKKVLTQYFKCDVFKKFYVEYFKDKLAGPRLIHFMKDEFNL